MLSTERPISSEVKTLGHVHILLGAPSVFIGAALLYFEGIEGLIDFGTVGFVFVLLPIALSLPGIIAGIGLIRFRPWAPILTIVLSVLNLANFYDFGALGGYGLWVLLSKEGKRLFAATPVQPV